MSMLVIVMRNHYYKVYAERIDYTPAFMNLHSPITTPLRAFLSILLLYIMTINFNVYAPGLPT